MDLVIICIFFIMGTFVGSFISLAIYRIPLKIDIIKENSFCQNCKNKLKFFDLIPIVSYIMLKGKCRYCKKKIDGSTLFFEIIMGILFVILFFSMNFNFSLIETNRVIEFFSLLFFISIIVLISGLDRKIREINIKVVGIGVIIQYLFILYFYYHKDFFFIKYSIYLGILILILLFKKIINKNKKYNYFIDLIVFSLYINLKVDVVLFFLACLLTCIITIWSKVFKLVKNNANLISIDYENKEKGITIGFYLGLSTIIICLIQNFTVYYN